MRPFPLSAELLRMTHRPLLIPGYPHLLHGGDYNPDQWLHMPEIIDEDFRLMKLAGVNAFSVGIFAWTSYEKSEGAFDFAWLDEIMDRMAEAGNKVIVATPSGAKPAWLAEKYPEVRRVSHDGRRETIGGRHNHCMTSPVYREKVAEVNGRLAERYAAHPALGMWHLSNEYSGRCYCDLCLDGFRSWLEERYGSIESLNEKWWTAFWSHTFTSFSQIDPRDLSIDSLKLDFTRFTSELTIDFMKSELAAVRRFSRAPATTNLMGLHSGINYERMVAELDLVADDQYPGYSPLSPRVELDALRTSFKSDVHRCFKPDRPWMVIESCPDAVQWRRPTTLKRAELHQAEMLQALGHGAEGTCYFQWRKGRAGAEKMHGAVVDHVGHENTRVFSTVARLGKSYEKLSEILGSTARSEVAIIYDWDVLWAFDGSEGPRSSNDGWAVGPRPEEAYQSVCVEHYAPLVRRGVTVDVIAATRDFSPYKVIIAPQLWMLAPGVAERLGKFVRAGGTLVSTYYSGFCDENNRCFLGGFPGGGLMDVFGIWNEETDWLPEGHERRVVAKKEGASWGLGGDHRAVEVCGLVHPRGATVLAEYAEDFYSGTPALTLNLCGEGRAFYHAARLDEDTLDAFYGALVETCDLSQALSARLPEGVLLQRRFRGDCEYLFIQNFSSEPRELLMTGEEMIDLLSGAVLSRALHLDPWASTVIRRSKA